MHSRKAAEFRYGGPSGSDLLKASRRFEEIGHAIDPHLAYLGIALYCSASSTHTRFNSGVPHE